MAQPAATSDLLLFGGDTGSVDDETWLWDDSATDWVQQSPATTPTARAYHAMATGLSADEVVMWGGDTGGDFDATTWVWDGADWTGVILDVTPSARKLHSMWKDPDADRVFLFGGVDLTTQQPLSDMWVWDGSQWFQVLHGSTDKPVARGAAACVAYDDQADRMVMSSAGFYAIGLITCVRPTNLVDGETITIADGATSEVFEFDTDSSAVGTQVDISVAASEDDVATALAAAINGSSLTVFAVASGAEVSLVNTTPAVGVVDITTTVANAGFAVEGMAFTSVDDTWSFDGVGRLWLNQDLSDIQPPVAEGSASAFDTINIVRFGGEIDGALTDDHYTWTFTDEDTSPYYTLPGTLEGRIQPSKAQATDGSWVFCLGTDAFPLPAATLDIGDSITIQQDFDLVGENLLRFDWRMRYAPRMPAYSKLVDAGAVSFVTSMMDASDGVQGLRTASVLFDERDVGQAFNISGATADGNNGTDVRANAVPTGQADVGYFDADKDQGTIAAGRQLGLDLGGILAASDSAVTVERLGARWRARCYVTYSGTEYLRAELYEDLVQASPDGWQRLQGAAHVSKITGVITAKFELKLIQITS